MVERAGKETDRAGKNAMDCLMAHRLDDVYLSKLHIELLVLPMLVLCFSYAISGGLLLNKCTTKKFFIR